MRKIDYKALNQAFKYYRDIFFEIDFDLRFWEPFIKDRTEEYLSKDAVKLLPYFNSAVFNAMHYTSGLSLENHYQQITASNIQLKRTTFFKWIENLSCLKIYNAAELFLIQTIYLRYFPTLKNPFNDKEATGAIKEEIKNTLLLNNIKSDKANNSYILDFLELKSIKIEALLERYIDKNTPVKRKNLFIMMGALRNIIAHHNAILNIDSLNHIKSISKPIFERYFKVDKIANNYINYYSKDTISYLNFISSFNDLILNLVAEISEEENFIFFDEM